MQHCDACGAELPNDAQFCGRCGSKTKSEDEISIGNHNTSGEDTEMFPEEDSRALNESPESIVETEDQGQEQNPNLSSVNNAVTEEHLSSLVSEHEGEKQTFEPTPENSQEQLAQYAGLEHELEEQNQKEQYETTDLMQGEINSESEILTNQSPDERLQNAQPHMPPQGIQNSYTLPQKPQTRSASRCLLFSLVGLIIIVGLVVAVINLLHLNLPGFNGSSNAQSSSAYIESVNPTGSSLTVSVCMNTSTPSTSGSNQGATFTLSSSSGCSAMVAAKANTSCLIFPNPTSTSRKYIVDVSNAAINSQSYHLVLGIEDFTGPSNYSDSRHISVGLGEGSTGRTFTWLYRSGSMTINNDEKSGTMDVILAAVNNRNTIHMVGNWACGSQLKNP